ncbi:hypothetical protein DM02DRAFT_628559 [Periconia macrospinosa]|uniref:Uncharacterized protein n=1 Tax=Periconia macrospinosa TaxID=97972 RepID=A0A2V1DQ59_9PLEO|nr:hypothetical protein DM02DRAFT_628559 [Periconia macrospinosa]
MPSPPLKQRGGTTAQRNSAKYYSPHTRIHMPILTIEITECEEGIKIYTQPASFGRRRQAQRCGRRSAGSFWRPSHVAKAIPCYIPHEKSLDRTLPAASFTRGTALTPLPQKLPQQQCRTARQNQAKQSRSSIGKPQISQPADVSKAPPSAPRPVRIADCTPTSSKPKEKALILSVSSLQEYTQSMVKLEYQGMMDEEGLFCGHDIRQSDHSIFADWDTGTWQNWEI